MIVPWLWRYGPFSDQPIPLAPVALSVALMPLRAITNIAVMIFSVTDRGLAIAAQLAIQSLETFLSTLIALFEFEMGVTSLFIGAFCGQFAALGVGLVALGRRHVSSSPSREWLRRVASTLPTTAASGIVDGSRGFGENALLTGAINLQAVGILGHARLYHGLLIALSGHNLWAKSLEEARKLHSSFDITRSACEAVVYRFLRMLAKRERNVPFQDHVAVFGSFAIFTEIVYVHWAVPPLTLQLALMTAGIAMLFVIGRRSINEMSPVARQIVLGRPA
jgi:hypothetical protein